MTRGLRHVTPSGYGESWKGAGGSGGRAGPGPGGGGHGRARAMVRAGGAGPQQQARRRCRPRQHSEGRPLLHKSRAGQRQAASGEEGRTRNEKERGPWAPQLPGGVPAGVPAGASPGPCCKATLSEPPSLGLGFPIWEHKEGRLLPGLTQSPEVTGQPPGQGREGRREGHTPPPGAC